MYIIQRVQSRFSFVDCVHSCWNLYLTIKVCLACTVWCVTCLNSAAGSSKLVWLFTNINNILTDKPRRLQYSALSIVYLYLTLKNIAGVSHGTCVMMKMTVGEKDNIYVDIIIIGSFLKYHGGTICIQKHDWQLLLTWCGIWNFWNDHDMDKNLLCALYSSVLKAS